MRGFNQTLTYWAPSTKTDLYGKPASSTPVQFKCRWEDRREQLKDKKGEELISKSRVFLIEDVEEDGYVFLGVSTEADPTTVKDAWEIQCKARQPDLRGLRNLTVLYL